VTLIMYQILTELLVTKKNLTDKYSSKQMISIIFQKFIIKIKRENSL
jgi:hypothetical protein